MIREDEPAIDKIDGAATRPAGMCDGAGHLVVYGNPAFLERFGAECVGLPAREGLIGLPPNAFELMDAVFRRGRALARWIRIDAEEWRMTVAPRVDPGTDQVFGVRFHLRARSDLPVVLDESDD